MSMGVTVAVRVRFAGCVDVHVHILARCGRKCTSLARPQCDAAPSLFLEGAEKLVPIPRPPSTNRDAHIRSHVEFLGSAWFYADCGPRHLALRREHALP